AAADGAPAATASVTAAEDGWSGVLRLPYALSYSTAYTAVFSVENSLGASAEPVSVPFHTKSPVAPEATLFASSVGFTSETFVVDVSSLGTDAGSATVLFEFSGTADFSSDVVTETRAVSAAAPVEFAFSGLEPGSAHWVRATVASANGKTLALGPLSVPTPPYTPPWFGAVSLAENWPDRAVVSVPLSALGAGTDSVTVDWTASAAGGAQIASGTLSYAAAGTKTVPLDGLVPGAAYAVSLHAAGAHGQETDSDFSFSTPLWLVEIGDHSAEVSTNGTMAAISANVVRASAGSTVTLSVNGAPVNSWNNVVSGQTVSWNHAMALGSTNVYSFAAADASGDYTDSVSGSFIARRSVGWFAVDWASDGYGAGAGWNNSAAEAVSGGAWTVPDEEGASFERTGGSLDVSGGSELLRFAAAGASASGKDVRISGRARFTASAGPLAPEAPCVRAGLALHIDGETGDEVLYGYDGASWRALEGAAGGAAPQSDAETGWVAEFDFTAAAPAVRYTVGGETFRLASDHATEWLPLSGGSQERALNGVDFAGVGEAGDFKALYYVYESDDRETLFSTSVKDVAGTSATVSASVYALVPDGAQFTVRYARNADFSDAVAASPSPLSVSATGVYSWTLEGLDDDTRYWVETASADAGGSGARHSATNSFVTTAVVAPPAGSVSVDGVSYKSAVAVVDVSSIGSGAPEVSCTVELSSDSSFSSKRTLPGGVLSAPGSLRVPLQGLSDGTAYWVRAVLSGSSDVVTAARRFSTLVVEPPEATLETGIADCTSASFSVQVSSIGTAADSATVRLQVAAAELGTFDAPVFSAVQTISAAGVSNMGAAGLDPGTGYIARVVVESSNGRTFIGPAVAFSTLPYTAPVVETSAEARWTDATVEVSVSDLGNGSASAAVFWTASCEGAEISSGSLSFSGTGAPVSFTVEGLAPGSECEVAFAAEGSNGERSETSLGFRTLAYGAPVFGANSAAVSFTNATVSTGISDLGSGSGWVDVSWAVTADGAAEPAASGTVRFSAAGSAEIPVPGLALSTGYEVSLSALGANGLETAADTLTFATGPWPVGIAAAEASLAASGKAATYSCTVDRADSGAALSLYLRAGEASAWGEPVRTWADVGASGVFSETAALGFGETRSWKFVLAAGVDPGATDERSGSVDAAFEKEWFDVRWSADGYAAGGDWDLAAAQAASGGEWSRPEGDSSAVVGEGAAARALQLPAENMVSFGPADPVHSPAGLRAVVSGVAGISLGAGAPAIPEGGAPIGGLFFAGDGPRAWNGEAWVALECAAALRDGASTQWKAEFDFPAAGAPRARYSVGGQVCTAASGGQEWIPIAGAEPPRYVSRLAFGGGGTLGDFRGSYRIDRYAAAVDGEPDSPYVFLEDALRAAGTAGEKTVRLLREDVEMPAAGPVELAEDGRLAVDFAEGSILGGAEPAVAAEGLVLKSEETGTVTLWYAAAPEPELVAPVALSAEVDVRTGTLSVEVADAREGLWYALVETEPEDGVVLASRRAEAGETRLVLDWPLPEGAWSAIRFKLVVSDEPFSEAGE
ncbi:MAG: hypothetical protein IJ783_02120, partial [Kiritimatiellae bacterium]|nr:hypothetical protein [Kiritimatiellia bacterium]